MKTLDQKQKEAAKRVEDRAKRTDQNQLDRLTCRPGTSYKERKRLEARIAAAEEAKDKQS